MPTGHRQPYLLDVRALALRLVDDAAFVEREDTVGHRPHLVQVDRKSTRLNSSHANISYAVFCLKKKSNFSEHYCLAGCGRSFFHSFLFFLLSVTSMSFFSLSLLTIFLLSSSPHLPLYSLYVLFA